MSQQSQSLAGLFDNKGGIIPFNGFPEMGDVFLLGLGALNAPIEHRHLMMLGEFINNNLPAGGTQKNEAVAMNSDGDLLHIQYLRGLDALPREKQIDHAVSQLRSWLVENNLTPRQMEILNQIYVCAAMILRIDQIQPEQEAA